MTGALKALNLPYEVFPEENPQVNEDFVWRTVPEPGTVVAEGTVIELYYNPTKALVIVPNVEGRSLADATAILGDSGFQIEEITELSDVTAGLVIRTEPAAETAVPQEQVIRVIVSGGPDQVSIPATVINDPVEVATALLESAQYGLVVATTVEQVDEDIPIGVVINTDPAPNMLVARGSTVTLIVSSGPGQVRVPALVGLTEGQARNLLDEAGLGIDVGYQVLDPGDPRDGTVTEQSVASGQDVDKGTSDQRRRRPGDRGGDHHDDHHHDHHHHDRSDDHDHHDVPRRAPPRRVVDDHDDDGLIAAPATAGRCPVTSVRAVEEVAQQVVAAAREDALRVELHTFHVELAMADTHHDPVERPSGDLECVGHRVGVEHERVVPGRRRAATAARRTPRLRRVRSARSCRASTRGPARRRRRTRARSPDGRDTRPAPGCRRRRTPSRRRR